MGRLYSFVVVMGTEVASTRCVRLLTLDIRYPVRQDYTLHVADADVSPVPLHGLPTGVSFSKG